MDDDVIDALRSIHQALASAQEKVMQALARQRLSPEVRDQLKLELNWITKRVDGAPN